MAKSKTTSNSLLGVPIGTTTGSGIGSEYSSTSATDPNKKLRMPDPSDPRQIEEMRRKIGEKRRKGGRVSTILSDELRGLMAGRVR